MPVTLVDLTRHNTMTGCIHDQSVLKHQLQDTLCIQVRITLVPGTVPK